MGNTRKKQKNLKKGSQIDNSNNNQVTSQEKIPQNEERLNFADLALCEDELHRVETLYGKDKPPALWQRLGDWYFDWKEHRQKHLVHKRLYLILTFVLGWAGIHRFYEKRWKLGLVYLLLSFTGYPVALAVMDFLIALPMKTDEKGYILI